jgi:hypothetical protein
VQTFSKGNVQNAKVESRGFLIEIANIAIRRAFPLNQALYRGIRPQIANDQN